jgi:hypothetical protein
MKPNYWQHDVYVRGNDGADRKVATYVTATTEENVKADLTGSSNHLANYLERFFRYPAADYARKHPLRAQALLGAFEASMDCCGRTGLWLPVEPPPTKAIRKPEDLPPPIATETGIGLWLIEDPSNSAEIK